jgi:hypothetical protein
MPSLQLTVMCVSENVLRREMWRLEEQQVSVHLPRSAISVKLIQAASAVKEEALGHSGHRVPNA